MFGWYTGIHKTVFMLDNNGLKRFYCFSHYLKSWKINWPTLFPHTHTCKLVDNWILVWEKRKYEEKASVWRDSLAWVGVLLRIHYFLSLSLSPSPVYPLALLFRKMYFTHARWSGTRLNCRSDTVRILCDLASIAILPEKIKIWQPLATIMWGCYQPPKWDWGIYSAQSSLRNKKNGKQLKINKRGFCYMFVFNDSHLVFLQETVHWR